jgi:hypothetical protein
MSAHLPPKKGKRLSPHQNLDDVLDFGAPEEMPPSEFRQRTNKLMKKIEEINQKIQNLSDKLD